MIKFKDYSQISKDDKELLDEYIWKLYNLSPLIDDEDIKLFSNNVRHIMEIISDEEIDNGKN